MQLASGAQVDVLPRPHRFCALFWMPILPLLPGAAPTLLSMTNLDFSLRISPGENPRGRRGFSQPVTGQPEQADTRTLQPVSPEVAGARSSNNFLRLRRKFPASPLSPQRKNPRYHAK